MIDMQDSSSIHIVKEVAKDAGIHGTGFVLFGIDIHGLVIITKHIPFTDVYKLLSKE